MSSSSVPPAVSPDGGVPGQHGVIVVGSPEQEPTATISVASLLALLRRHHLLIVLSSIAATLATAAILAALPPRYEAEAVLNVLDQYPPAPATEVVSRLETRPDELTVGSQIDAVLSLPVLDAVVDRLSLASDPEFNPRLPPADVGGVARAVRAAKGWSRELMSGIGLWRDSGSDDRRLASERLQRALQVTRKGKSRVISVKAISSDPKKAADIANAVAAAAIANRLEAKQAQRRRETEWLHNRLDELRKRVVESEREVERLRSSIGRFEGETASIAAEQLSQITRQLSEVRAERDDAEAKYSRLQALRSGQESLDSVEDVLASPLIQRLREQETTFLAEQGRMLSRFGDRYPDVVAVNAQIENVRKKIRAEIDKIAQRAFDRLNLVNARLEALAREKNNLEARIDAQNAGLIKLREVQQDVDTNRATYEAFAIYHARMAGFSEIEPGEMELLSPAAVPTASSSLPPLIILGATAFGSFWLAFLGVCFREGVDRGLRSAQQVGVFLGLPTLALIPQARRTRAPQDLVLTAPECTTVEAIRYLYAAVDRVRMRRPTKLLFCSALPGDGKTVTAVMLAREAAHLGEKTLFIDLDLRKDGKIGDRGETVAAWDLSDRARTRCKLRLTQDRRANVSVLSPYCSSAPFRLLYSPTLWRAIDHIAADYELVVIDSPPILSVPDAKVIATFADWTVFVARWGATKREVAAEGVTQLRGAGANMLGAVLTQVRPGKYTKYGFGEYGLLPESARS